MHDAGLVCDLQGVGYFRPDLRYLMEEQCPLTHSLGESLTFQELHDQIIGAVLRANVVEMTNVRMIQGRQGSGLAFEPLLQLGGRRKVGRESLDRNRAVEASI